MMNYPCQVIKKAGFLPLLSAALLLRTSLFATDSEPKRFNVPSNDAQAAIKSFSEQAGIEVLYRIDLVGGVATAPVKGEMPLESALAAMLAGTGLEAVRLEPDSAFTLRKKASTDRPKVERAVVSSEATTSELYHTSVDPFEYHNLAGHLESHEVELRWRTALRHGNAAGVMK